MNGTPDNNTSLILIRWVMHLSVVFVLAWESSPAATLAAPTGLLVNGMTIPRAVVVAPPLFSWIMNDVDRSETQSVWQVVVSANGSIIWDSGKCPSARSSGVPYGGLGLASATIYRWKVRLRDKDDQESPFSDERTFINGLSKSDS